MFDRTCLVLGVVALCGCAEAGFARDEKDPSALRFVDAGSSMLDAAALEYQGSGSVAAARDASVLSTNVLPDCGFRPAGVGTLEATDGTTWTVPAATHFAEPSFPVAADLHNTCAGVAPENDEKARSRFEAAAVVEVDRDGEVFTGAVYADNYFELYVNGVPVGKDAVPYTPFNTGVMRFRAKRPFTIAIRAVDWEQNLGFASEPFIKGPFQPGDGGLAATFLDAGGSIVATTSAAWKAQTFYVGPVASPSCLSETGGARLSNACSAEASADGRGLFTVHWKLPLDWMEAGFDDSAWPAATAYSNEQAGVGNKPAFTNFPGLFDAPKADAQIIWTNNLVLDNDVALRFTVR